MPQIAWEESALYLSQSLGSNRDSAPKQAGWLMRSDWFLTIWRPLMRWQQKQRPAPPASDRLPEAAAFHLAKWNPRENRLDPPPPLLRLGDEAERAGLVPAPRHDRHEPLGWHSIGIHGWCEL